MTPRLLPPWITITSTIVGSIAIAVATSPWTAPLTLGVPDPLLTLFGKPFEQKIIAACALVALVAIALAGGGRSFIKSVDNPQAPSVNK